MHVFDAIRQRARPVVGPIVGISLVAYFAYHLVQGDRGLIAWLRLTKEIDRAHATLTVLEAERRPLAHRVSLMGRKLDPDLLDERVRAELDLIGPDEVAIFYPRHR